MAHAGTPTGLAHQPAASSSTWKFLFGLVAVLAIGIAMVIAVLFIASRAVAPTGDKSYNQIEAQRAATTLAAANSNRSWVAEDNARGAFAPAVVDNSAVEAAAAARARAMSGVPADNSLDAAVRAAAAKDAMAGDTFDTSYTSVENARAKALSGVPALDKPYQVDERPRGTTIDPTTFDRTPRGAHGQLP